MRKSKNSIEEGETLEPRLLAGVFAVPLVEVPFVVTLLLLSYPGPSAWAFRLVPLWIHFALIATAFTIGLISGYGGLVWLIGHLFYTHFPAERNARITTALWLVIALATVVISILSTT